jgi:uncharacterized membrane protein
MKASDFFNKKEKKEIILAIREAEKETSGEIKVHLENRCKGDLMERTKEIFSALHLYKTEHKNAVLIYIAPNDKKVSIIGDEGIHNLVPDNYWDNEIQLLTDSFKRNDFKNGIIETIGNIGKKLKLYFPYTSNDINEISDLISFYDN